MTPEEAVAWLNRSTSGCEWTLLSFHGGDFHFIRLNKPDVRAPNKIQLGSNEIFLWDEGKGQWEHTPIATLEAAVRETLRRFPQYRDPLVLLSEI